MSLAVNGDTPKGKRPQNYCTDPMLIPRRHAAACVPASRATATAPPSGAPTARSPRLAGAARGAMAAGRLRALLRGPDRRGEGDSRRRALGQALLEGGGGREQRIQHGPVAGLGAAQVADGLHGIAERAPAQSRAERAAPAGEARSSAVKRAGTAGDGLARSAPPSARPDRPGRVGHRQGWRGGASCWRPGRRRPPANPARSASAPGVQRRRRRAQRRLQGSDPALAGGAGRGLASPCPPPARRRGCPG